MKKTQIKSKSIVILLLIVLLSLFIYGCSSVTSTSAEVNIPTSYSGNFESASSYMTSGKALISSDKAQLVLSSFSSTKGPDLKVWLATSKSPTDYKSLGALRYEGNQNYDLPAGIDLDKYSYVLIWCEQASRLFGSAKLTKVTQ